MTPNLDGDEAKPACLPQISVFHGSTNERKKGRREQKEREKEKANITKRRISKTGWTRCLDEKTDRKIGEKETN